MDNCLNGVLVGIPEDTSNLQLPNPELRDYYRDEQDRIFWLNDNVENCAEDLIRMILHCNKEDKGKSSDERKPIKIFIDSPGGDLVATFTMINAIKLSKTPVYTINIGAAYSGGFFIFLAGHKRFAYELSSFLFHEGSTGTSGDAGKFRNFADFYKKELDKLKSIVLKYTKISDEEYEKHIKDDWWFTADEAIEYGICDEILTELIY